MSGRFVRAGAMALMLALAAMLSACRPGTGGGQAGVVAVDALLAGPRQFAGRYICAQGAVAEGFESVALAADTRQVDGHTYLTEPVIWLEGAEIRSRQECSRTGTLPPFEFCHAVACGLFETGGGFGHGGSYAYQIRGREAPALSRPSPTPAAGPSQRP